ncbi:MAG: EVE domain-containing protein [Phycisphaerales bacterium]
MATFLFKTEPGEFSFARLLEGGRARWDGVSSPAANKHLRSIAEGDDILIFHTADERAIVGLARAVSGPYADPARPEKTAAGEIKFVAVDVEAIVAAKTPVPLAQVKADERFAEFPLVTQGRLSVMPVPAALDKVLRSWAGLPRG